MDANITPANDAGEITGEAALNEWSRLVLARANSINMPDLTLASHMGNPCDQEQVQAWRSRKGKMIPTLIPPLPDSEEDHAALMATLKYPAGNPEKLLGLERNLAEQRKKIEDLYLEAKMAQLDRPVVWKDITAQNSRTPRGEMTNYARTARTGNTEPTRAEAEDALNQPGYRFKNSGHFLQCLRIGRADILKSNVEYIGIPYTTYNDLESGTSLPEPETLLALREGLFSHRSDDDYTRYVNLVIEDRLNEMAAAERTPQSLRKYYQVMPPVYWQTAIERLKLSSPEPTSQAVWEAYCEEKKKPNWAKKVYVIRVKGEYLQATEYAAYPHLPEKGKVTNPYGCNILAGYKHHKIIRLTDTGTSGRIIAYLTEHAPEYFDRTTLDALPDGKSFDFSGRGTDCKGR